MFLRSFPLTSLGMHTELKTIEEHDDSSSVKVEKSSSMFGGYTILAKSMMGSGLLGVAGACAKGGWILGIFFSILIPVFTFMSLHLLTAVALRFDEDHRSSVKPITFFKLSESVLGKLGAMGIEISLILKTFGASIVYLQVAGSMLSGLILTSSMSPLNLSRLVQVGMALLFAPFCFLKRVTKTSVLNAIGIGCLVFIVAAAFIFFDPNSEAASTTSLYPSSATAVLSRIPIFVFAYTCHHNLLPCIDETRSPTVRRVDTISALACITGFLMYTPVMVFPYATFGSSVADNFLKNLPVDDLVTKIAYVCAAVSVCISFPLQVLPLRNSVCSLLFMRIERTEKSEIRMRYLVASVAVAMTLAVAVSVQSLGVVMAITGLVGGNTICFLAPSLLYLKMFRRDHKMWYVAVALLVSSLALYTLCLGGIFMTL